VQIAHHYHKTPAQVMLQWGLQKGFIVLPKSVTPQRILQNIQVTSCNLFQSFGNS
jgi:diketogulonate reductase-like aldo/keto reductase